MEYARNRITFRIYHNQELEFQLEEGLTLFFGLNGESFVLSGEKSYEIGRAGLLVINPMEMYQLTCPADAAVLRLHLDATALDAAGWDRMKFCACYAESSEGEEETFCAVRRLLAEVFQEYLQNHAVPMDFHSPLVQMLRVLQQSFSMEHRTQPQREATIRRMKHILDTVHQRWDEDISLSEIAKQEYLSVSYLSRFFQKNLNMNFSQYIRRLRLIRGARMLTQTEKSITHISYDCGFKTPSAFIEAFKQQYHKTPGQFREQRHSRQRIPTPGLPKDELSSDVSALLEYSPEEKAEVQSKQLTVSVDCAGAKGKPVRWRRILNIGYARDGLLAPVQAQIRQAQSEIGYEFIRFHGLLDNDMHIYWEDEQGNPMFHFSYVNMLFDFILSLGLAPYVELSFMPPQLAREQTRIFDRQSVFSGCIALDKWTALIQAVMRNFLQRYGAEEVHRWKFTTVSRSYMHLGCVLPEDYDALYYTTYRAIKAVDEELCFGGPGCFAYLITEPNGFAEFFNGARQNDCIPDFISMQSHPHNQSAEDDLFMSYTFNQQSAPAVLSDDEDFLIHSLEKLHALLQSYGLEHKEIFIEECTSTLWQRDLSGDTCYKASWLAKNICDNADQAVFGYWLLTDFMEERAMLESVYHGGYGMFTYNGIPKASYCAMRLLSQLGEEIVDRGDNWMLTRQGKEYRMIVYNCCRYSNVYRYRYKRLENPQDAYSVFEPGENLQMQVCLEQIPDGMYCMEEQRISREGGSSFDKWLELGAPRYPDGDTVDYLIREGQESVHRTCVEVQNGLRFELQLSPMDTVLLRIWRKN